MLLVGHVDTVHARMPTEIYHDAEQDVIWSPTGLGADDRAGIYGILKLLNLGYRPHVLFTDGEEVGGTGAEQAAWLLSAAEMKDVRFMIELDRQGSNDCVFYSCDNGKAQDWVESFGFETSIGSFTDISILMSEWKIAGVNLSIGYYGQHSRQEILKLKELEETVRKVALMLDNPPKKRFKYHAKPSRWYYTNSSGTTQSAQSEVIDDGWDILLAQEAEERAEIQKLLMRGGDA